MTIPQHIIHKLGELGISTEPNTNIENWNPIPVLDHEEQQKLSDLTILASYEQLIEQGFGVVQEVFTPQECDELIEVIRSQTKLGLVKNLLFEEHPLMYAAVVNERVLTLARTFLGEECILMSTSATILGQAGTGLYPKGLQCYGLHSDQPTYDPTITKSSRLNAPRNRNNMITFCVVLSDGYNKDTGATYVVPGTHKLGRHPTADAISHAQEISEPIVAGRGDAVFWDGNVWHAFGVRQIPGERIVVHITFGNPSAFEAEDHFDAIPASSFMGKPYEKEFIQLLRRDPTTGEVVTPHPRTRQLYWEEVSIRFMEALPKSFGFWLYKLYMDFYMKSEIKKMKKRPSQQ